MTESSNTGNSGRKRILKRGVVVSDKMDKSISVKMDRQVKHPLYGKYVKRKTMFKAHDEKNEAYEGDLVEIEFCRPRSKTKRWRLVRVVKQGPNSLIVSAEATSASSEGGES